MYLCSQTAKICSKYSKYSLKNAFMLNQNLINVDNIA